MFCKSCGTKLEDGAKFCPSCGTPVTQVADAGENTAANEKPKKQEDAKPNASNIVRPAKMEVKVRGHRSAGAHRYGIITMIPSMIVLLISSLMVNIAVDDFYTNYALLRKGWILTFASFFIGIPIRLLLKRRISYNENMKRFFLKIPFHEESSLGLSQIKDVRLRYVQIPLYFKWCYFVQSGKYYVVVLDTEDEYNSLDIWFSQKDNAEEFLKLVEYVFASNNLQIDIDRDEELTKISTDDIDLLKPAKTNQN